MKYAGFMPNDFINGKGICVSFWTQGCPYRCLGCHNSETWDFNGGYEVPEDIKDRIIKAISANGIQRGFSILGGEPLCEQNRDLVNEMITAVRTFYPNIKIYLWTGYVLEDLISQNNSVVNSILEKIDVLIDGPFELEKRDITLELRGSTNQRILYKNIDF